MKTVQLPNKFIKSLITFPETGMGYQLVKVFLRNGKILREHKVLNSSLLVLEAGEIISENEIEKIEPESTPSC